MAHGVRPALPGCYSCIVHGPSASVWAKLNSGAALGAFKQLAAMAGMIIWVSVEPEWKPSIFPDPTRGHRYLMDLVANRSLGGTGIIVTPIGKCRECNWSGAANP
jgi:hypothetical protein